MYGQTVMRSYLWKGGVIISSGELEEADTVITVVCGELGLQDLLGTGFQIDALPCE